MSVPVFESSYEPTNYNINGKWYSILFLLVILPVKSLGLSEHFYYPYSTLVWGLFLLDSGGIRLNPNLVISLRHQPYLQHHQLKKSSTQVFIFCPNTQWLICLNFKISIIFLAIKTHTLNRSCLKKSCFFRTQPLGLVLGSFNNKGKWIKSSLTYPKDIRIFGI